MPSACIRFYMDVLIAKKFLFVLKKWINNPEISVLVAADILNMPSRR
jgi:hypothetical protein